MVRREISYEVFLTLKEVICRLDSQVGLQTGLENQLPALREAGEVLNTKPVQQHSRVGDGAPIILIEEVWAIE